MPASNLAFSLEFVLYELDENKKCQVCFVIKYIIYNQY